MREMIAAFQKNGHEVITLIAGGEKTAKNNTAGINLTKQLLKKITPRIIWETLKDNKLIRTDKALQKQLIGLINKHKPDLIYERGYYLMPSAAAIAKKMGIKHILEINAPYIEERIELQGKTLLKNKALAAEKEQIENTNLLVVVSSPLKKYFTKKYSLNPAKVLVTPNAINTDDIKISPDIIEKTKNELSLNGKTIIGFVGSIFPYHGVDLLIDAAEQLKKEGLLNKAVFLIIGDGETLPDLKSLTQQKNLENEIIFTGKIPHEDIYNYIQLFDIAIMAKTNWYCSPIKLFEYAALKKPIISADTEAVRDVITPGTDGLLVQPNVSEITDAIKKYISNSQLRSQHGSSFFNKIKSQHTWQLTAKKIIESIK